MNASNDDLSPPAGIQSSHLEFGGQQWLVLSFPHPEAALPLTLTSAERAVALDVIRGLSNESIAKQRRTSQRTVANQVASVFRKTSVGSRIELARRFARDAR